MHVIWSWNRVVKDTVEWQQHKNTAHWTLVSPWSNWISVSSHSLTFSVLPNIINKVVARRMNCCCLVAVFFCFIIQSCCDGADTRKHWEMRSRLMRILRCYWRSRQQMDFSLRSLVSWIQTIFLSYSTKTTFSGMRRASWRQCGKMDKSDFVFFFLEDFLFRCFFLLEFFSFTTLCFFYMYKSSKGLFRCAEIYATG